MIVSVSYKRAGMFVLFAAVSQRLGKCLAYSRSSTSACLRDYLGADRHLNFKCAMAGMQSLVQWSPARVL